MMNIKMNSKIMLDHQIDAMFRQLDQNEDKYITKYEFVDGCLKDEFLLHFLSANF